MSAKLIKAKKVGHSSFGASTLDLNNQDPNTIRLFNAGNPTAFTEVYNQLYRHVFYFACRFVEKEDAADISAEAFLKLWKGEKAFDSLNKVKIFLQVCVRNACINHLGKMRLRADKMREFSRVGGEPDEYIIESDEVRAILLRRITQEIENLPQQAKRIFRLAVIDGMDSKAIALKLGVADSTVRNQKKRAIDMIRLSIGVTIRFTSFLVISWLVG